MLLRSSFSLLALPSVTCDLWHLALAARPRLTSPLTSVAKCDANKEQIPGKEGFGLSLLAGLGWSSWVFPAKGITFHYVFSILLILWHKWSALLKRIVFQKERLSVFLCRGQICLNLFHFVQETVIVSRIFKILQMISLLVTNVTFLSRLSYFTSYCHRPIIYTVHVYTHM